MTKLVRMAEFIQAVGINDTGGEVGVSTGDVSESRDRRRMDLVSLVYLFLINDVCEDNICSPLRTV